MAAETSDVSALPLVLLPGTLCDGRLFSPLLARLTPRDVVLGDMHGLSTASALAERLLERAPSRFALLGFSLGAIVALEVATLAPGRVAGLALVGGNAHDVPAAERTERRAALAGVIDPERHVAESLWPCYVADGHDADMQETVLAMARDAPEKALAMQTDVALTRADSRPRLAGLAMPTLVLAGMRDAINPPAVQREMAGSLPHARLELVPDAGHFVLLEQPDASARAVAAWLHALDASDQRSMETRTAA